MDSTACRHVHSSVNIHVGYKAWPGQGALVGKLCMIKAFCCLHCSVYVSFPIGPMDLGAGLNLFFTTEPAAFFGCLSVLTVQYSPV